MPRRVLFALLLLYGTTVFALEIPEPTGYVNDHAKLLSSATTTELETRLRDFETSDSTQITLLTIPSLAGEVLEQFSLKVFKK